MKPIKISAKSMRLLFHPCTSEYIRFKCHGRCCEKSGGGTMITIHESERQKVEELGGRVEGNFLTPNPATGKCVFKTPEGFCGIHEKGQPFGCKCSPFTLNPKGTLIIRNRYRLMICFKNGQLPAYKAHKRALAAIIGEAQADNLEKYLDAGGGDKILLIEDKIFDTLIENDKAKKLG